MSNIWSEVANYILNHAVDWIVPFIIGLLLRKRVGRWFVKARKYLANEPIPISFLYIRSYHPTKLKPCGHDVYDNLSVKIPGIKLLNMFQTGLRISIPSFGNFKISVEPKVDNTEQSEDSEVEEVELAPIVGVKAALTAESPIVIGVRNTGKLNELSTYCEVILSEIERGCLENARIDPTETYTIIDLPRTGHFLEQKTLDIDDEDLGVHVSANEQKISLTIKASTQIASATKKYLLS
jgi:hypothetical protein